MILYEVNLQVRREIVPDYLPWLRLHMAQMRALPGFVSAELWAVPERDDAESLAWCAHYRLHDEDALQRYLRDDAPRMRADGIARFGDGFRARRRVLASLEP